jgi:hypothetical protein
VIRWRNRAWRAGIALTAFMALVVGSGADWRWN